MMFFLCYVYFLYYKLICCILIMIGYFVYKKYLFEFFRFVKWVYVIINLFVSIVKIKKFGFKYLKFFLNKIFFFYICVIFGKGRNF